MIRLQELAFAKVNLYLHVTGRRADGYHLLDSLIGFATASDRLEAAPADEISLKVEGPYAEALEPLEGNSVLKAAHALRALADIRTGAALTLYKTLPVAAGIGGGSADAAAALRLLQRLWKVRLPEPDLMTLALKLGADVPVCLRSRSLYMSGIGEGLKEGPSLSGLHLVLVNPNIALSTQAVFKAFGGKFSSPARQPAEFATPSACIEFIGKCHNDLQPPAIAQVPEITETLESLASQPGCVLSRMSGSGATCFGLFKEPAAAQTAAERLSADKPNWWVKEAAFN